MPACRYCTDPPHIRPDGRLSVKACSESYRGLWEGSTRCVSLRRCRGIRIIVIIARKAFLGGALIAKLLESASSGWQSCCASGGVPCWIPSRSVDRYGEN